MIQVIDVKTVIPSVLLMRLDKEEQTKLVARAKNGDQDALVELYDAYAPDIYRYTLSITRDEDTARDVVSEAFLRAWTNLPTFKGDNFRAYLYTIARNYTFDILRKEAKCITLDEEPTEHAPRGDVLKKAIQSENNTKLMTALSRLPDQQREIITLRFMEEQSVKETAAIMGMSEISVRVTQCRALKKLKKLLS